MSPDLAGSDALFAVPENVALHTPLIRGLSHRRREGDFCETYSDQINEPEDEDDDAAGDDDAPEGQTEGLLAGSGLIEVAEHVDAECEHGQGEGDKAVRGAEEWPVAGEVGAEKGQLGYEKEHCCVGISSAAGLSRIRGGERHVGFYALPVTAVKT